MGLGAVGRWGHGAKRRRVSSSGLRLYNLELKIHLKDVD